MGRHQGGVGSPFCTLGPTIAHDAELRVPRVGRVQWSGARGGLCIINALWLFLQCEKKQDWWEAGDSESLWWLNRDSDCRAAHRQIMKRFVS